MKIYFISPNYRKLTIWHGDEKGERQMTDVIEPMESLDKVARFDVFNHRLQKEGFQPIVFQANK